MLARRYLVQISCVAAILSLAAPMARAQAAKVTVVDISRVLQEMQETKDLQKKLSDQAGNYDQTLKQKRAAVEKLRGERDNCRPDSQQYQDKNKELLQASIDFRVWSEAAKADMEHARKQQLMGLFNKIRTAVGELSKERGIDLVLASRNTQLPDDVDQVPAEKLQDMLRDVNVLYSAGAADISNDVIARLDAAYKGGK